jgi:Secretion system C-terminal sorting domain
MTNKLLTIIFLGFGIEVLAQPTFTQTNYIYQLGDQWYDVRYSAFETLDFSTTGSNNIWDFSDITYSPNSDSSFSSVLPVATGNCAADFPTADFLVKLEYSADPGYYSAQHFKVDATQSIFLGVDVPGISDCSVSSDPEIHFPFPFSLGDSFTDNIVYGDGTNLTLNKGYVASGDLILPGGMVHFDCALIASSYVDTIYTWYEMQFGRMMPVFNYSAGFARFFDQHDALISVQENQLLKDIKLLPLNNGNYQLAGSFIANPIIEVLDINGRPIQTISNSIEIKTSEMSDGMYFARVKSGAKSVLLKFVVGSSR